MNDIPEQLALLRKLAEEMKEVNRNLRSAAKQVEELKTKLTPPE